MNLQARHRVVVSGPAEAQPMVFAHGFGCDQNMWRHVAPAFADEFRTVVFDYVGAGGAAVDDDDPDRYAGLAGYVDDVLALIREMDLHDVVFVGHSVSAMIGALAEVAEPDRFDKLVMVSPSPRFINDGSYVGGFEERDILELLDSLRSNYLGWSSVMAPVVMGNPDRPELGHELTASFCRMDPEVAARFARATFLSDNREVLPRIGTRTLVLQCSQDAIAPVCVGEYVAAHIPHAALVILDATGHCPNLSAPDQTIAAIEPFVRATVER